MGNDLETTLKLYKTINSDYAMFLEWSYIRDPPYWEKLLQDWEQHVLGYTNKDQLEIDFGKKK